MPKPIYFYTQYYPHSWTSGPRVHRLGADGTLEKARELAEFYAVGGLNKERCVTTYGVMYEVDEQAKS